MNMPATVYHLLNTSSHILCRGVSSCSSLGWPVGWPHLYLGAKNSGWHNA